MNADDRGRNLAEARHAKAQDWRLGLTASRVHPSSLVRPAHGGHPDPRCACAGTGYIHEQGQVTPCPEHIVGFVNARDPRGEPPTVDWECVAGRALADLQTAMNELKRLRLHMPVDVLREYDRRFHA